MNQSRYGLILAFLMVNLVWGTTFMAIRIGVHDLPPALFSGSRFVLAGIVMAFVARFLRQPLPRNWHDWKVALVTALLMICGGNGVLTWAEQWLPSNQAALLVTAAALWLPLLGTLGSKGVPLTWRVSIGLAIGFAGTALMFWPGVNEAIGLIYLEAQAAGVPVLAQDRPGLSDVIAPCLHRPAVEGGPEALAQTMRDLLDTPPPPERLRAQIAARHLLPSAADTLRAALLPVLA